MTQIAKKAPKWSFGGRQSGLGGHLGMSDSSRPTPGPIAVNDTHQYTRQPVYTFGKPGLDDSLRSLHGRSGSSPPGPDYNANRGPSGPHFSFGTTKRRSPFEGGFRGRGSASQGTGPKHAYHWGTPGGAGGAAARDLDLGGPGPGAYGDLGGMGKGNNGPKHSFGQRTNDPHIGGGLGANKGVDTRDMGTHFHFLGHNDFGRAT